MKTLIDGQALDHVTATDRGLLFGDGLFETMAFWNGQCPLWERHMRRLTRGCRMLGIASPKLAQLEDECWALAKSSERIVIRLTLTRGSGGRGYWPDITGKPTRILQSREWPESLAKQQQDGLKAITSTVRLNPQPALAGLKHCNRIEQILAAQECQQQDADEALLFDQSGRLAEAVSSNLLLRYEGRWITPSSTAAVAGVGLEWLLADPPLTIQTQTVELAQVSRVDSILMINSVGGIRPLSHIDHRALIIDQDCRRFQLHWNQQLIPVCDDC